MKYLKYLLILILVLVLVFFISGLLNSSISYESEMVVNKPAAEAWAVMSDQSKVGDWIQGYKKSELLEGTANTIGAVSNIYTEDAGQEYVMKEVITDIQTNKRIAMDFFMDFMNMKYAMDLEEVDGKTKIKSSSTTTGNGMIAKSMVSFMKGMMKEQEDKNMSNLKKLIEENTTNYFPEPDPALMASPEEVEN